MESKESHGAIPEWAIKHPAWLRLEDQLIWYDSKSKYCQKLYKRLKFSQITLAVLIPIISLMDVCIVKWGASIAGALIATLEGVQHMNQYATLWVTYRSTAERLKHEKYLFLSSAGPYKGMPEEERLVSLSERVEEHVSSEHANWFNEVKRANTAKTDKGRA